MAIVLAYHKVFLHHHHVKSNILYSFHFVEFLSDIFFMRINFTADKSSSICAHLQTRWQHNSFNYERMCSINYQNFREDLRMSLSAYTCQDLSFKILSLAVFLYFNSWVPHVFEDKCGEAKSSNIRGNSYGEQSINEFYIVKYVLVQKEFFDECCESIGNVDIKIIIMNKELERINRLLYLLPEPYQ
uniref:Uncharacterized protein n=1 Tax=Strongyloides venezuelensis TaxID=75913 RepID=A0A0K0FC22_STRVS